MVKVNRNINLYVYGNRQSGVVLIVVLLLLVILSSIAMLAIKESNTGLKVTTAMQANKLMFQANDAAFVKLQTQLTQGVDEILPFLLSNKVKEGHIIIICMQSNNTPFSLNRMTHKQADGGIVQTASVANGYCDVTNSGDYHNAGRVVTQMSLLVKRKTMVNNSAITGSFIKSTNTNTSTNISKLMTSCLDIDVKMTSIMPIVSNASNTKINACLQKNAQFINANSPSLPASASDQKCLANSATSFMSHQQTFRVVKKEAAYANINQNSNLHVNLDLTNETSEQISCLNSADNLMQEGKNMAILPTNWLQLLPN